MSQTTAAYLEAKKNVYKELAKKWIYESHKSIYGMNKAMFVHAALSYYAIYRQYAWMQTAHPDEW